MSLIVLLLMTLLNRVRGGGMWIGTYLRETLHVKPLFVVFPLIVPVALLAGHTFLVALLWSAAFLIWALPAWGRWFDLGNLPDDYGRVTGKFADPLEGWIVSLGVDDMKAMFLRHGVMLLPICIAMSLLTMNSLFIVMWPLFTAGIVTSYIIGWAFAPATPILIAELISGAIWGAMICMPN